MKLGYPDSVRNAVYDLIRSGTTPGDLMDQFGIGWGTCYRWLETLRSQGEDVSFVLRSDIHKERALARLAQGASITELCEELGVSRAQLYRWREEYQQQQPSAASPEGRRARSSKVKEAPCAGNGQELSVPAKDILIRQLKIALAEKTVEADFFRSALRGVEERRRQNIASGAQASTTGSDR